MSCSAAAVRTVVTVTSAFVLIRGTFRFRRRRSEAGNAGAAVKVVISAAVRGFFAGRAAGVAVVAVTADVAGFAAAGRRCIICYIRIRTSAGRALAAAGIAAFLVFSVTNQADAAVRRSTNLIITCGTITFGNPVVAVRTGLVKNFRPWALRVVKRKVVFRIGRALA